MNQKLIGIRIMQKRKEHGLNQEQLSEQLGISKNHLSNIERGVNAPTTICIFKLCEILGETPNYYLIGQIEPKIENKVLELLGQCPPENQVFIEKFISLYLVNI